MAPPIKKSPPEEVVVDFDVHEWFTPLAELHKIGPLRVKLPCNAFGCFLAKAVVLVSEPQPPLCYQACHWPHFVSLGPG